VVIELVKGGGWRWDDPKSKAAVRSVYFPAALVQEFKRHRIKQNELRRKMGSDYQENDLVFATSVRNTDRPAVSHLLSLQGNNPQGGNPRGYSVIRSSAFIRYSEPAKWRPAKGR